MSDRECDNKDPPDTRLDLQDFQTDSQPLSGVYGLDDPIQAIEATLSQAPPDHPNNLRWKYELGTAYGDRYQRSGNLDDLEKALYNLKRAVEGCANDPTPPQWQQDLSLAYLSRFQQLGNVEDLQQSLDLGNACVSATPLDHPGRLMALRHLGFCYAERFRRFGNMEDLQTAIEHKSEALKASSPQNPNLPILQHSLAVSLTDRCRRLGNQDDINTSIKLISLAISSIDMQHPKMAEMLHGISAAYGIRYRITNVRNDLEKALQLGIKSLFVSPLDDPRIPLIAQSLAVLHYEMFLISNNADHLASGLKLLTSAVEAVPHDYPLLRNWQQKLSVFYDARYSRLGDIQDLEKAINFSKLSLEDCPHDHPDIPERLHTLSKSYTERFRVFGNQEDLGRAIGLAETAAALAPRDDPAYPTILQGLAASYSDRYRSSKNLQDLHRATELNEKAVALAQGELNLATYNHTLSVNYLDVFHSTGQVEYLHKSRQCIEACILSTPQGHHLIGNRLTLLAKCYLLHYENLEDKQYLDMAIENHHKALLADDDQASSLTCKHQLGEAYHKLYQATLDVEDLYCALYYTSQAAIAPVIEPISSWKAACRWATVTYWLGLKDSLTAHVLAFEKLPEVLWIGHSMKTRLDMLGTHDVQKIMTMGVLCALGYGRPDLAVEFSQQGLAITFHQLFELKNETSELEQQHPGLAHELRTVSAQLAYSSPQARTLTHSFDLTHSIALRRKALLQEIRELPGLGRFSRPTRFKDLAIAAREGPIIILICREISSHAIILVSPMTIKYVALPGAHWSKAQEQLKKLKLGLREVQIESRYPHEVDRAGRLSKRQIDLPDRLFKEVLDWLRTEVTEPVFNMLRKNDVNSGRIWWCPSGPFTYLPLHATAPHGPYIPSYTPTLDILNQARFKKAKIPDSRECRFVAVGMSDSPGGLGLPLPAVREELAIIRSIFENGSHSFQQISNSEAKVDVVLDHVKDASWVHLSCHGKQTLQRPLESGFLLHDGTLQLEKVIEVHNPNAQFAFLSACQTAMGEESLSNESMHLAGGFMAAGFCGVIGTLWSIADVDAPLVTRIVYEEINKEGTFDVAKSAEAVQLAVQKLIQLGLPYHRWVPFIHLGI